MKKLSLLSAFALLFTIFSCTSDEIETQATAKKKIEKINDSIQASDPGPGDSKFPPPPPN